MTEKTLNLTGTEIDIPVVGSNCWLRNDSTSPVYASRKPGISAGADGVISVPSGGSAPVYGTAGHVYLLGSGSVLIIGTDYSTNPFKSSAQSGGSGADEIARAAVSAHSENAQIHISAKERTHWNELCNPNMLINPDFSINQRDKKTYDAAGYTVDKWKAGNGFNITAKDGVTITSKTTLSANMAAFMQEIGYDASFGAATLSLYASATHENAYMLIVALDSSGAALSQSAKVHINSGLTSVTFSAIPVGTVQLRAQVTLNSGSKPSDALTLRYAKLECSEQPTRYLPPDNAVEMLKCQRYYQIRSTGSIAPADLRPTMVSEPDIFKLENGNYEYIAK